MKTDSASTPQPQKTILVVEDDAAVRKFLLESLGMFGYRVMSAADGEEALRIFEAHQPRIRLIITDVIMPKMNGKDLYEAVRRISPDVKALFLSGYTADVMKSKGLDREEAPLLPKPVVIRELLGKIRGMLDH